MKWPSASPGYVGRTGRGPLYEGWEVGMPQARA